MINVQITRKENHVEIELGNSTYLLWNENYEALYGAMLRTKTLCDSCQELTLVSYYEETDNYHCLDCRTEDEN